ncbi:MOSC domain-containing protein [Melghirimyces algeriensis]|uniref:MOSC domain-containing protein YiiM n=1 Tax=Melghirimyces algeriensis TaxID=910412 RepID=A0A521EP23_9BACL|nr:MOSC domain-containing protein [Melghirimyces algeriensis]SMO85666.1 MOSC domain-containing protein YiiM [Melghirimyces algeriensis]
MDRRNGGRLQSLQVGKPRTMELPNGKPWHSGIFKQPVEGPVRLGKTNLEGDGQADLKNHGGSDKAILAYAVRHYDTWQKELGISELNYGMFGENFTVDGLDEETVCIGDVYQVGTARLQVSQSRIPCWKLDQRWEVKGIAKRITENGKSGWYLRVLEEGVVEAGQFLTLIDRPVPQWNIQAVNDILHRRNQDAEAIQELCGLSLLADSMRKIMKSRLKSMRD